MCLFQELTSWVRNWNRNSRFFYPDSLEICKATAQTYLAKQAPTANMQHLVTIIYKIHSNILHLLVGNWVCLYKCVKYLCFILLCPCLVLTGCRSTQYVCSWHAWKYVSLKVRYENLGTQCHSRDFIEDQHRAELHVPYFWLICSIRVTQLYSTLLRLLL